MKKTLLSCLLVALCFGGAFRACAAPDPGDRFLEAYFLIQEGDGAVHDNDWLKANAKYAGALDILKEIKTDSPDWNPHIIEFRSKYIADHLAEVKAKLNPSSPSTQTPSAPTPTPTTTPPPSAPETQPPATAPSEQPATPPAGTAPAPAPTPPAEIPVAPTTSAVETSAAPAVAESATNAAPAAESDQVKQLRSELERARTQVEQLESARNDLNAKLQEQLAKVAPTQTTPQIEDLMKTNQFLAAQLAAAQTAIEEAKERAAATPPPAPGPSQSVVDELKTELAQARSELQDTRQQLQDTRLELGTTKQALAKAQADNVELRRSYEQVIGQLTDANKKLTAAKASSDKDDEIIRQLRKENALLRIIAERKASDSVTAGAEEENGPGSTSESELRGWHPRPRQQTTFKPHPDTAKPRVQTPTQQPSTMEESSRGKLVATVTAPKKSDSTNETVVTETPAPAPSPKPVVAPKPTPPPAKPTPPPVKTTPAPAPVKPTPAPAPKPPAPVLSPEDQAKAKADAASTTSPNVRTLLNEARAALALKDYNTAATKYTAVLALEPTNIVALSNLGVIRYQQNRLDDAETYLRQAAAAAPNDSNTRSLLGVVYFRKGAIEDAYAELNRAVAIDPHNAEAHNYLGIVLSEKGWGASGELEIRRAIEINPQYPDAHFNLAVIYAKQRNPKVELAKYHYRKALDLGAKPDPELEALLKKLSAQPPAADDTSKPDTTKPADTTKP